MTGLQLMLPGFVIQRAPHPWKQEWNHQPYTVQSRGFPTRQEAWQTGLESQPWLVLRVETRLWAPAVPGDICLAPLCVCVILHSQGDKFGQPSGDDTCWEFTQHSYLTIWHNATHLFSCQLTSGSLCSHFVNSLKEVLTVTSKRAISSSRLAAKS